MRWSTGRVLGALRFRYKAVLWWLIARTFRLWERLGFHVTPNRFTEPIPDSRHLPHALWERRPELVGIDLNEESQRKLLVEFSSRYQSEYDAFPQAPTAERDRFFLDNAFFESVDAEVLYCMIRHFRPRRIVEIGSGYSTLLAAQAVTVNRERDGAVCDLVAVEPFPSEVLRNGVPGLARLLETPVERVPIEEFTSLGQDDILFIDSSHILRIGGDVQYEFLEILPRLAPGVLIHVHDVFLPYEYPKEWVLEEHRFYTEQYLLQAFLSFNQAFQVLWAGYFMHREHPDELRAAFGSYRTGEPRPGSFWMRRIG
jgi:hypothetical protein